MASDKNPVRTIRVAPGSALERLIAGKPFTEAVHKIAEVLELAMAEEAAQEARSVEIGEPYATLDTFEAMREPARPVPPRDEYVLAAEPYDPFAPLDVTDDEAVLRAAAEQYPSGLVPVAVVRDDDEDSRDMVSELI